MDSLLGTGGRGGMVYQGCGKLSHKASRAALQGPHLLWHHSVAVG